MALGETVARMRRRRGLTQEELAHASGVSVIRKLERGDRDTVRLATLRLLAGGLGVRTTDLMPADPVKAPVGPVEDADNLMAVRRIITPARGLGGMIPRFAEDLGSPPTVAGIQESVREANRLYQGDDYTATLRAIPVLIAEARQSVQELDGKDRLASLGALAAAYQLTGSVLTHLRHNDLAYQALSTAIDTAQEAGDSLLAASAVVSLCWVLLRERRLAETEETALRTAEAVEPSFRGATRSQLSVYGWLLLRAAAAAVRNNRREEADEMLRQAKAAATLIGPERIDYHEYFSTFGPVTVAMKTAETAVISGDADRVLRIADSIPKSARPTSNNANRFRLDVAAAHVERRQYGEATHLLLGIRRIAPEWLRQQRYARDLTGTLVDRRQSRLPRELADLADFLDIAV